MGELSANVSDEGADLDKPNFNEDEDNFDLSDIITKLDVQIEHDPLSDTDCCFIFKCTICGLDSKNKEKIEEHIKTAHNKRISKKIIKKQEMVIHIERKKLSV